MKWHIEKSEKLKKILYILTYKLKGINLYDVERTNQAYLNYRRETKWI